MKPKPSPRSCAHVKNLGSWFKRLSGQETSRHLKASCTDEKTTEIPGCYAPLRRTKAILGELCALVCNFKPSSFDRTWLFNILLVIWSQGSEHDPFLNGCIRGGDLKSDKIKTQTELSRVPC
jgi:hypothetical protein